MNYTEEQFKALSQWEENFRIARDGKWAKNPGRGALAIINDALNDATKVKHRLNAWCQQCILNLLQQAGKLYFADKAEMERIAEEAKKLEKVPEPEFDPAPVEPAKPKKKAPAKKADSSAKKETTKKTPAKKTKAAKTEL